MPTEAPPGDGDEPLIRPDTFWELIEKLLLNKTRDEQSRRRHNAALSALCRGHALPRVPREKKLKSANSNKNVTVGKRPQEEMPISNSTKFRSKAIHAVVPLIDDEDHCKSVEKNQKTAPRRSKSVNRDEKAQCAKEARSECSLKEQDIVYVKEASVPASERLWRYAIKNRKKNEIDKQLDNHAKTIPSIRSNQAIYLGLRKRLESSLQGAEVRGKQNKKERIKRRHSCDHIQKIRSDVHVSMGHKPVSTIKRTVSFQNTQAKPSASRHPDKPTQSFPPMRDTTATFKTPAENGIKGSCIRRWQSRDQVFSPWGTDESCADLGPAASARSRDRFDSKKALYNSVIKRRLNCGSQLDSLNKEILIKKNSPRSVLSKDTTKKYAELKNEYLNLCYQESTLRHQISLLHAEIYMMHNKSFHRTPASIKTITFDAQTTPLHQKPCPPDQGIEHGSTPMFPSLKAPRPLFNSTQRQPGKKLEKQEKLKKSIVRISRKIDVEQSNVPMASEDSSTHQGVCSIYSITPHIVTQQR